MNLMTPRYALCVWSVASLLLCACGPVGPDGALEADAAPHSVQQTLVEECSPDSDPSCGYCGDGICGSNDADYCPSDCEVCGNRVCENNEYSWSCPSDCGTVCGDNVCNGAETVDTCYYDCGLRLDWVLVERVRHCRNDYPWPCNSRLSRPEYGWWDHFNVAEDKQKRTFLSRALEPPRSAVRHLVFIATGQQGGGNDDDEPSMMTGQNDEWKMPFRRSDMDARIYLREGSLARLLVQSQLRSPDDTFMGLAFDARFNYNFSVWNKQEIENAYYEWLKGKFDPANLRSIYLAGHSRGGCLVFRLARRFKQDFPGVTLVVHGFDPVCNDGQNELNTWDGRIDNPSVEDWEWFARPTHIPGLFPNGTKLAVLNMVSGGPVLLDEVDWTTRPRAFSFNRSFGVNETLFQYEDWYEQRWYTSSHHHMGDGNAPIWRALRHLQDSCNRLGC